MNLINVCLLFYDLYCIEKIFVKRTISHKIKIMRGYKTKTKPL